MSKVRIYEIGKELGVQNAAIIEKAREIGLEVDTHLSYLEEEDALRVKTAMARDSQGAVVEKRVSSTVIRRRPRRRKLVEASAPVPTADGAVEPAPEQESLAPVESATTSAPVSEASIVEPAPKTAPAPEVTDPADEEAASDPGLALVAESVSEEATAVETQESEAAAPESVTSAPELAPETEEGAVAAAPDTVVESEPEVAVAEAEPEVSPAAELEAEPESVCPPAPRRKAPQDLVPTPRKKLRKDPYKAMVVSLPDPVEVARQRRAAETAVMPKLQAPGNEPSRDGRARRGDKRAPPGRDTPQRRGKRLIYDRRKEQGYGMGTRGGRMRGRRKKERGAGMDMRPTVHIKRIVKINETISVGDLAAGMAVKASEMIQKLFAMGVMATVNQELDFDTAQIVAEELGHEVQNVAFQEEEHIKVVADEDVDLESRQPVVTIMGHVDHGKTSLLDVIQKSNITDGEAGGITQAIGAYVVKSKKGKITFIDTPGHEAFTAMRARGAKVTDLVILVVAADDGVMPQTREAVSHSKAAGVPIIVAVNKVDRPEADPQRVRQELMELDLVPEEWGGETLFVDVSAKTKVGINDLVEAVVLQAEMADLKANPNKRAAGIVLESRLEKGRGPVATLLVQEGTMHVGDILVSGTCFGKVRAMLDDRAKTIKEAGPSIPVEVLGLSAVPVASDSFNVVEDDKAARNLVEHRATKQRDEKYGKTSALSLEQLFAKTSDQTKEIAVVLKGNSQGAIEALSQAIRKLHDERVEIQIVHEGVGGITETDVNLALAGGGFIIGFNVRPEGKARTLADQVGVEIKTHALIHDIIDMVKAAMEGALDKVANEVYLGRAEVREIFRVPRAGRIAGSYIIDGKIPRTADVRLIREGTVVWQGKLGSLRRFKDDAKEVAQGYECGIGLEGFNDIKNGDIIEAYTIEMIAAKLEVTER